MTWEDELPIIAQSKAQVLFLGDHHHGLFHQNAIQELIREVAQADSNLNCYLSELDPTWFQKAIDDTLSKNAYHNTLAARVFQSTPAFIQTSYDYDFFDQLVRSTLTEPLFDLIRRHAIRWVAIDQPKTEKYIRILDQFPKMMLGEVASAEQWDERNRIQMINRNHYMASQIRDLFRSKTCTRAIVFLGEDHITQFGKLQLSDDELRTVPQIVSKEFLVETIIVLDDGEAQEKYERKRGPSPLSGGLQKIPLREITYTPTIMRW